MTTSRYDFHGVRIELESELEDVAAAMERRLRQFSTSSVARTDVTFAFAADSGNGTGLARPEGEGRAVYETPLGEVAYFPSGDVLYLESHDGVRAVCTGAEGRSRVSVSRAALANVWLLSRPLLTLPLVELLKRRGLFSVHAAGVELDGSGVVIAGASGSGKSTLALALVREGFHLLGDDMLFLREGSEGCGCSRFRTRSTSRPRRRRSSPS